MKVGEKKKRNPSIFLAIYWNLIRKIWQSGNFFVFEIWRIWAFFPRKILVFSGWNLAKFCTKKIKLPTQFLHSDISHNLGICFIEPEKGMKSVKKSLSTMWMRFCSWMLACLFFSPSSMIFFWQILPKFDLKNMVLTYTKE
jgi:hypothetical protein